MEVLSLVQTRRLALVRAGLLRPDWADFPTGSIGGEKKARAAAMTVVRRFGYLQLDTVSTAGARSHVLVLLSRLPGFPPALGEALLQPGEPLFEYWGHEACWMPMELYPAFHFRRQAYRRHPWWGDLLGQHPQVARRLRRRVRQQGPLRSIEMEGEGSRGWWDLKVAKKVATALWSSGEWSIRRRRNFQRSFDLTERVIPETWRKRRCSKAEAFDLLLLQALEGHGWATTGTLAATWRLRNCRPDLEASLRRLQEKGLIQACGRENSGGRPQKGWIRCQDLELADRVRRLRPRSARGVLLSPFDPLLWDRARVAALFDFDQVLEIFKPAPQRKYGYYCLPVLTGEQLLARVDLKADRKAGRLNLLNLHYEGTETSRPPNATARKAAETALDRYSEAVELSWRR
ncbi:MAG: winged helix-turn-helix domain-containing protein [Planctomycetota bacterium]|nr:MAG: winged helix-turn-helix domain-containing protein [Planctomycetota bacterium]